MSLDVLSSKQIEINCSSLNANTAAITGAVSIGGAVTIGGNITVNDATVNNLDVNGFLYFDTISDYTALEHNKVGASHSLQTTMFNGVKDYVIDESYTVGDIVKLTLGVGVPLVQVANLHFICINDTNNNPTFISPDWTYIGVIFSDTQAYPLTITKVIHNGLSYNANSANGPGAFNLANWTLNGLAPSNINENTIFNQTIDSSGCSITLGKNSKDYTGMLKLVSKNTDVSEIQSLTGNIVLIKPVIGLSVPASYNDKACIYYDSSGNLITVVSRNDDAHLTGIFFTNHTISSTSDKTLMALTQKTITSGGVVHKYGEVNTEIVNSYGLNLAPATTPLGYETCGTAQLVAAAPGGRAAVTVLTNACGPNSKIFLSKTILLNESILRISAKTQTSFTVEANNHNDTSTFDWMLINPDFTA